MATTRKDLLFGTSWVGTIWVMSADEERERDKSHQVFRPLSDVGFVCLLLTLSSSATKYSVPSNQTSRAGVLSFARQVQPLPPLSAPPGSGPWVRSGAAEDRGPRHPKSAQAGTGAGGAIPPSRVLGRGTGLVMSVN